MCWRRGSASEPQHDGAQALPSPVSNAETDLQQRIRLALGLFPDVRLWRNNSGKLPDPRTGRWVQFGVASPGGSDLIGYRSITITPEMVGQKVAVFTALEIKTASGRATPAQKHFIDHIRQAGGIAGIVRSVAEAQRILGS
jgi:hypothetical protein